MNEVEKMRSGQLADMSVPEMQVRFERAKKLLARMRGLSTYDGEYRPLLESLVPGHNPPGDGGYRSARKARSKYVLR